jgi:hypothetical protein
MIGAVGSEVTVRRRGVVPVLAQSIRWAGNEALEACEVYFNVNSYLTILCILMTSFMVCAIVHEKVNKCFLVKTKQVSFDLLPFYRDIYIYVPLVLDYLQM